MEEKNTPYNLEPPEMYRLGRVQLVKKAVPAPKPQPPEQLQKLDAELMAYVYCMEDN